MTTLVKLNHQSASTYILHCPTVLEKPPAPNYELKTSLYTHFVLYPDVHIAVGTTMKQTVQLDVQNIAK